MDSGEIVITQPSFIEAESIIEKLTEKFVADVEYDVKPDPKFLAENWTRLMAVDGTGRTKTYAGYVDNVPRGFLLGTIQRDLLTGKLQGLEHTWFVEPLYRMTGLPIDLLRAFEADCDAAAVDWIVLGCSEFHSPERRARGYRKLGYVPHGGTFFKRIT
jgi:hypothetical protein